MAVKNYLLSVRSFFVSSGKKEIEVVLCLFILFLLFRVPLLDFIYHQDEHKWVRIVNPVFGLQGESVHPPLTEITFYYFGELFGYEHLRWLILLFAVACFWLVFMIAREHYGRTAALFSLLLFAVIPYNVIASIQIDIDGAILPFWILLTWWSFAKINWANFKNNVANRRWLIIFCLAVLGGLLSKVSFVLIAPGLLFYYLHRYQIAINRRLLARLFYVCLAALAALAVILLLLHWLYPPLSPVRFLEYTRHFSLFNFSSRNYFQVLFLVTKSILLLSPFLLLLFNLKKLWRRHEFWGWYLIAGLLFYLVLFDFSNRTVDRYMMFLILPLVFIGGDMLARLFEESKALVNFSVFKKSLLGSGVILLLLGLALILSNNKILPLVPKTAYLEQVRNLDFSFLLPFSSGSGPLGFYMSVKFIVLFWLISLIAMIAWHRYASAKLKIIFGGAFLTVALIYCLLFNAELAYGWAYGSPDKVAKVMLEEVVNNDRIEKVVTYNDTGTYELDRAGKHGGRFYTQPLFAEGSERKMRDYFGYYLVIDFPEINKQSVFWRYLQSCGAVFQTQSKKINGYLVDCKAGDKSLFND